MSDNKELVRIRAYELWRLAGEPEGRSDEFWFAAERELQIETAMGDREAGAVVFPAEEPPVPLAEEPLATQRPGVTINVIPPVPLAENPPAPAFRRGAPTGMPAKSVAERAAVDERLEERAFPWAAQSVRE